MPNNKHWNPPWAFLPNWSIVGMNHYFVEGEKRLFVAMVKDGLCIKEEGKDDVYLWNRLWHQARCLEQPHATTEP